jgi:hypothetical protein
MRMVNEKGIAALKAWVEKTRAEDDAGHLALTDERALDAWAQEAEESMANGGPPLVEMPASHSKTGKPETFTLSESCIKKSIEESEVQS